MEHDDAIRNSAHERYATGSEIWPTWDRWNNWKRDRISRFCRGVLEHFPADLAILNAGSGSHRYEWMPSHTINLDRFAAQVNQLPNPVVGEIEALPFADGTFDLVICVGSVINYASAMESVRELARVLRPGGRLILHFETTDSAEHLGTRIWRRPSGPAQLAWGREEYVQPAVARPRSSVTSANRCCAGRVNYPPTPHVGFPRIKFDRNGNIWGAALSGGMFLIPAAANVGNSGKPPLVFGRADRIGMVATLDVFPDREGNIWISSTESLHRFHPANAVPVTGVESNPSGPQRLAVATDESVYLFSLGSLYQMRPNAPPSLVASALGNAGVVCTARSGGIWFLQGAKTLLFDDRGQRTLPLRAPDENPILCEEDGFGRLWALSKATASWFRDGVWHSGFPGLGTVDIWDVATDPSGALILSLDANKLVRIDENKVTQLQQSWGLQ